MAMGGEFLLSRSDYFQLKIFIIFIMMTLMIIIIKVLLLLVPAALLPGMWSVLFVFAGYVPKHR